MSLCECRQANAPRRYIDDVRYICCGLYQVGIDYYGNPVVFTCDTEMVDQEAVARIEAEEERARRKRQELVDAVVNGPRAYCACGTIAVRRCARCYEDICNDDDHCCIRRDDAGGWVCRPCDRALTAEATAARRAQKAAERARYEALPTPSVAELARYLDGDNDVVDGSTHRLDLVTHAELA